MSTGSSTQASTFPAGSSAPALGSSAAGRDDSPRPAAVRPRRRWLPRLQDTRIRSKLTLILFVPLAAVLALAAVRLVDVGRQAVDAGRVEDLTRLGTDVSGLTQALHQERMAAAEYLANPKADRKGYNALVAASDERIDKFTTDRREIDDPPAVVATALNRIDDHLRLMDATRKKIVDRDQIAVSEAVTRYGVVTTDLIGYHEVLSQYAGEGDVADSLRALSAFARAKAGTAEQEAVAYAARSAGDVSDEQLTVLTATQTGQQEALESFSLVATPAQQQLIDDTVTGDAVNLADQTATRIARKEAVPAAEVTTSLGAVVDLMRWAEQRLEGETLARAADESSEVGQQTALEAGLILLVLVIAVALAVVLARSLNNSLRRLREGALAVANRDLPDAVARLRDVRNLGDGGVDDIVDQLPDAIRLTNRDEVGQVAQAFNVVHREAVRIAAEQAALRTTVSAMFLNLARRSQSLVDRMIGELDTIERTEEDPKRLARLFELDHLATRMRRNDENLLVLAGADSSAPRREDALVVDALRAAQSEVELYNRIEFGTVDTDISIMAVAVNDVVRLVAELLDNATRFSPPNTVVVADGRRIRDYVVIQVEDRGLGMSEEQMESLNRRLAETPDVDVAAFRLMGLAVVGRLAGRYGIRVELRANIEGGTVAQVILPNSIVILPNSRPLDPPGRGPRQLDAAPAAWNDPTGFSRAATATLPAVAPDPWRDGPAIRAGSGGISAPQSPAVPKHPLLPAQPSQLPGPGEGFPTPNRPALPKRGVADRGLPSPVSPASSPISAAPISSASVSAAPISAAPVSAPAPAASVSAPAAAVEVPAPAGSAATAFPMVEAPANRPVSPNPDGWGAALAEMPPAPAADSPAEPAPIFLQMQQSWFLGGDETPGEEWSMPTAGYAPPPNQPAAPADETQILSTEAPVEPVSDVVPEVTAEDSPAPVSPAASASGRSVNAGQNGSRPADDAGSDSGNPSVPRQRRAADDAWRTAADEGWQRAMAAAQPNVTDTTRSGLPKRTPQAQLVPGGVQSVPRQQNRRSPDQVRGLLSAYHRGVQRGRTAGSEEAAALAPAPKENGQ
ncbi:nitrate- and nitrite sensing domain-containing protein [Symbioplanes lichenis]|uniref:nitrate- and nitrite sensing domain-containing protein n=1 Tax=Symbioplanes lichenis TaxID=1629072 RepID=UPI002738D250|nr:nitrate- and nitrite sensing domain-containing protein [Actinoplanes lichenis]